MTIVNKLALVTGALLLLNGCGGSGDDESPSYTLQGKVSGLNGVLVIGMNSNTFNINQDGIVFFGDDFKPGDQVSITVRQQPQNQVCALTGPSSFTFGNAHIADVAIACENVAEYTVSGTAAGLVRSVTLQYQANGGALNDVIINDNGSFEFANKVLQGTELAFSVKSATGHTCEVSPTQITATQDIDNLALSCSTFGKLNGRVTSYGSGSAINMATISVFIADQNGTPSLLQTATSDNEGRFTIDALGYQERIVVETSAPGYATRSDIALTSEDNPETNSSIALVAADVIITFEAASAATLSDTNSAMQVSLPAAAFVNASGQPATGTITAALTNIDASSDPAIMPGYYLAVDPTTGNEQAIESFGAINAHFMDAQGGALQLAQGVSATIRIPVAARATTPPATIPLLHFNEQTGVWDIEGEATLQTDEQNRPYYLGTVGHFSTWNADALFSSVNILGCAVDNNGADALSNVRIIADGTDYIGRSVTYTNADGEFQIAVRPNSQVLLSVRDTDGQSNTQIINVGTTDLTLDDCLAVSSGAMTVTLTWGDNPRDLDTHFLGPRTENSLDDRFRIYFSNKEETINNVTMYLDRDDTTSYGPEVLTVPQFPLAGRYRYAVHHYNGSGTVFQSPTRVEARVLGETYIFSPTADESTSDTNNSWVVFDVEVTAEGVITVIPVDAYMRRGSEDISGNAVGSLSFSAKQKVSL